MNLDIVATLMQFVAKLTVVLAAGWLAHASLSRQNPRWRTWLWRVAATGIAVLLIAVMLPPLYGLPVLPVANDKERQRTEVSITESATTVVQSNRLNASPLSADIGSTPVSSNDELASRPFASAPVAQLIGSERPAMLEAPAAKMESGVQHVGWRTYGFVLYVLVVGLQLLRLTIGMIIARRVTDASVPAPNWVQAISLSVADELNCFAIAVRVTNRCQSPVLSGVLRPTILLPESMLASAASELDVRGAIAHEVAHAAGHDLPWDLLIAFISSLIWPHPLAWKVRGAHRTACERISDRLAADCLGSVAEYQGLVARIALRVSGAGSSFGLAMARRADVCDRLAGLAGCPGVPRLGRGAALIAVCLTMSVGAMGVGALVMRPASVSAATESSTIGESGKDATQQAADKKPAEQKPDDKPVGSRPEFLRFKVIRSDNSEPVHQARILMRYMDKPPFVDRELITNANGVAKFEYPDGDRPFVYLAATVRQPGLVPYFVSFGGNLTAADLPTEKTIRMDAGKKIGGTIVDSEGNIVSGATLEIHAQAVDSPTRMGYPLLERDTKSGEDGTWLLDGAPLDVSGLQIRIGHPGFISDFHPIQDRADGRYVLDPGLKLTGRVVDGNGQPVPGAQVTIGSDFRPATRENHITVADDGSYLALGIPPQIMLVTVEAPGFAPQMKTVVMNVDTKPVDFQLLPGQTTRFKVVNPEGQPLAAIRIVITKWRGFRTLRWDARTDEHGLATWNGAPSDEVNFDFLSNTYAYLRDVAALPQDEPHVIRLDRPLMIEGVVTGPDGKNVPEFRVTIGHKIPGRADIPWTEHFTSDGRDGQFQISYNEACDEAFVKVEAKGFRTWISEGIPFRKSPHKASVRLVEAASPPTGTVWSPNGEPAAGAQLTQLAANQSLTFMADYRPQGPTDTGVSDQQGHFELLPATGPSLIVAVHDSGYAELTAEKLIQAGGIRLQAWAKVEVTVRRGAERLVAAFVKVDPDYRPDPIARVFHRYEGVTNAEGKIAFNRVVPSNVRVSKMIEPVNRVGAATHMERSLTVALTPGQTAHVELGGSGSTVTGRLSVAGESPLEHQWSMNEPVAIVAVPVEGSKPYYSSVIDKDGSFRAVDIPKGRYELRANLNSVRDPNVCGHPIIMSRIKHEFEVAGDAAVVDLGVLESAWPKWLGAGDAAPLFDMQSLRQEPVRLIDYRGRLLLIHFWAGWCERSMATMPKLAAFHKEFSADARFQMVGASRDFSSEQAAAIVKNNGWSWTFVFAGSKSDGKIPSLFEAQPIPEAFLIDIDGTILYRGRDPEQIEILIRKRLKELPR